MVLLAAGASRRLGQPKALAELPQGTPLARLSRAATEAAGRPPTLVTGAHHAELCAAAEDLPPAFRPLICHNPVWERGRTGSLISAAREIGPTDLCVLPIDHPRISSGLLERLFSEWRVQGAPARGWLAPAHGSPPVPGHPIVIGRALVGLLLEDPTPWQARPLFELRSQADPLWLLPVDDPTILENLDLPEDLAALRELDGH